MVSCEWMNEWKTPPNNESNSRHQCVYWCADDVERETTLFTNDWRRTHWRRHTLTASIFHYIICSKYSIHKSIACTYAEYQFGVWLSGVRSGRRDYIRHLVFEFYSQFQLYSVAYSQCVHNLMPVHGFLSMNDDIFYPEQITYSSIGNRHIFACMSMRSDDIGAVYAPLALVATSNCYTHIGSDDCKT